MEVTLENRTLYNLEGALGMCWPCWWITKVKAERWGSGVSLSWLLLVWNKTILGNKQQDSSNQKFPVISHNPLANNYNPVGVQKNCVAAFCSTVMFSTLRKCWTANTVHRTEFSRLMVSRSSTSPNPLLFPISIGAVYLWTCSGPWHCSSPPPLQGLSVHLINELWPTEARGKTLADFKEIWPSPWLSFYHSSAWRGTKGNGFCHRLSALISLLNQIPIIQTYWKPLEASICKFQKKMQSCALHRLADLSTIFEPNWFRSKVKAHPVPINHLSSHSVFAAATTHTPWTLIHSFTPSKVAPQPLALFFCPVVVGQIF